MYWLAAGYFAVYFGKRWGVVPIIIINVGIDTHWYLAVQFVLFPQPFYDGPQRVEELNPTTLTAAINDPNAYVPYWGL